MFEFNKKNAENYDNLYTSDKRFLNGASDRFTSMSKINRWYRNIDFIASYLKQKLTSNVYNKFFKTNIDYLRKSDPSNTSKKDFMLLLKIYELYDFINDIKIEFVNNEFVNKLQGQPDSTLIKFAKARVKEINTLLSNLAHLEELFWEL